MDNNANQSRTVSSTDAFRAELSRIQNLETADQSHDKSEGATAEDNSVVQNITVAEDDVGQDSNTEIGHDDSQQNETELDEDGDEIPNMIPKGRFKKVVERRKELEAQMIAEREARIKAETELKMIAQAMGQMNKPQQQALQPQEENQFNPLDEEAHNVYMDEIKQTRAQLDAMKQEIYIANQERAFAATHPDMQQAYQHLVEVYADTNKMLLDDPQQAINVAIYQLQRMSNEALKKGKNVPELLYNMAQRCGYQKPSEAPKTPKQPTTNLNAINNNMKKSATAEVNNSPLPLDNGSSNGTRMEDFDRIYKGNPDNFYILQRV